MDAISEFIKDLGEKALDYFARSNEIRFFPEKDASLSWSNLDLSDEDHWRRVSTTIQVLNYSNVSEGATFEIDFENDTFEQVFRDPERLQQALAAKAARRAIQQTKSCIYAMTSAQRAAQSMLLAVQKASQEENQAKTKLNEYVISTRPSPHDGPRPHKDYFFYDPPDDYDDEQALMSYYEIENQFRNEPEDESDSELDGEESDSDDSDGEDESDSEEDMLELLQAPPAEQYDPSDFFTRVKIISHKPFGELIAKKEKSTTCIRQQQPKEEEEEFESNTVLDRAIEMAHEFINSSSECSIRQSLQKDMPEYSIAEDWDPAESLTRPQGWARRMTSGLYGETYMTDEFKEVCTDQFLRGVKNKGDKQSPSQTIAVIMDKYPGLYCYPGPQAVLSIYAALNKKHQSGNLSSSPNARKSEKVPAEVRAEFELLVKENPTLTAKPLVNMWKDRYVQPDQDIDDKELMYVAGYLRAKRQKDEKRDELRNICG